MFRDHSAVQRRGWSGWLEERRLGYCFAPKTELAHREDEEEAEEGPSLLELVILPGRGCQWHKFLEQQESAKRVSADLL